MSSGMNSYRPGSNWGVSIIGPHRERWGGRAAGKDDRCGPVEVTGPFPPEGPPPSPAAQAGNRGVREVPSRSLTV